MEDHALTGEQCVRVMQDVQRWMTQWVNRMAKSWSEATPATCKLLVDAGHGYLAKLQDPAGTEHLSWRPLENRSSASEEQLENSWREYVMSCLSDDSDDTGPNSVHTIYLHQHDDNVDSPLFHFHELENQAALTGPGAATDYIAVCKIYAYPSFGITVLGGNGYMVDEHDERTVNASAYRPELVASPELTAETGEQLLNYRANQMKDIIGAISEDWENTVFYGQHKTVPRYYELVGDGQYIPAMFNRQQILVDAADRALTGWTPPDDIHTATITDYADSWATYFEQVVQRSARHNIRTGGAGSSNQFLANNAFFTHLDDNHENGDLPDYPTLVNYDVTSGTVTLTAPTGPSVTVNPRTIEINDLNPVTQNAERLADHLAANPKRSNPDKPETTVATNTRPGLSLAD